MLGTAGIGLGTATGALHIVSSGLSCQYFHRELASRSQKMQTYGGTNSRISLISTLSPRAISEAGSAHLLSSVASRKWISSVVTVKEIRKLDSLKPGSNRNHSLFGLSLGLTAEIISMSLMSVLLSGELGHVQSKQAVKESLLEGTYPYTRQ